MIALPTSGIVNRALVVVQRPRRNMPDPHYNWMKALHPLFECLDDRAQAAWDSL